MEHNKDNTRRRPPDVDRDFFISEWNRIFGSKDKEVDKPEDGKYYEGFDTKEE